APSISDDVAPAVRVDEREIRPPGVREEPDWVGSAATPVIHRTEPLVLRAGLDDSQRTDVGRLQRTPDRVMAVDGGGRLHSPALDRIGDGAKRRMRVAPLGHSSWHRDHEGRSHKRNSNYRGKSSREREAARGKPGNGNQNRKRVAGRVELLKEQVE